MLRRPGREPKSWWRWWLGPRSDAQGRDADKPPGAVGGADDQHSQQHQVHAFIFRSLRGRGLWRGHPPWGVHPTPVEIRCCNASRRRPARRRSGRGIVLQELGTTCSPGLGGAAASVLSSSSRGDRQYQWMIL